MGQIRLDMDIEKVCKMLSDGVQAGLEEQLYKELALQAEPIVRDLAKRIAGNLSANIIGYHSPFPNKTHVVLNIDGVKALEIGDDG